MTTLTQTIETRPMSKRLLKTGILAFLFSATFMNAWFIIDNLIAHTWVGHGSNTLRIAAAADWTLELPFLYSVSIIFFTVLTIAIYAVEKRFEKTIHRNYKKVIYFVTAIIPLLILTYASIGYPPNLGIVKIMGNMNLLMTAISPGLGILCAASYRIQRIPNKVAIPILLATSFGIASIGMILAI